MQHASCPACCLTGPASLAGTFADGSPCPGRYGALLFGGILADRLLGVL